MKAIRNFMEKQAEVEQGPYQGYEDSLTVN